MSCWPHRTSRGRLQETLQRLSETAWRHPISEKPTYFARSTIERWYYRAKNEVRDPIAALRRPAPAR